MPEPGTQPAGKNELCWSFAEFAGEFLPEPIWWLAVLLLVLTLAAALIKSLAERSGGA